MNDDLRQKLVADVEASNELPAGLIDALLSLELKYQNLHAYGATVDLGRDIETVIESFLPVPKDAAK